MTYYSNIKTLRELEEAEKQLQDTFNKFFREKEPKGSFKYKKALQQQKELMALRNQLEAEQVGKEVVKKRYITDLIKKSLGYEVYKEISNTAIIDFREPGHGDFLVELPYSNAKYYVIYTYGKNTEEKAYKISELLIQYDFEDVELSTYSSAIHCSIFHK